MGNIQFLYLIIIFILLFISIFFIKLLGIKKRVPIQKYRVYFRRAIKYIIGCFFCIVVFAVYAIIASHKYGNIIPYFIFIYLIIIGFITFFLLNWIFSLIFYEKKNVRKNLSDMQLSTEKANAKAKALAKANANMTKLYLELEDANKVISDQRYKLEQVNSELSYLIEAGNIINETLDIDLVLEKTFQSLQALFNFDVAITELLNQEKNEVELIKIHGKLSFQIKNELIGKTYILQESNCFSSQVIQSQKVKIFNHVKDDNLNFLDPIDRIFHDLVCYKSVLYFPLLVKDRSLGCVAFYALETMLSIDSSKVKSIQAHIPLISLAINNALTYQDLRNTKLSLIESQKISQLTDIFRRFVPEQFLSKIAKNGIENIEYGYGENVKLSILFSDMRSFSTISEMLDEKTLFELINNYFDFFSKIVYKNKGFVDKFIGDAVLSLFEIGVDKGASGALLTAVELQRKLIEFNEYVKLRFGLKKPIGIGVGIHTGSVIMGTVGSKKHMESTVLGDNVNISARLEELNKKYFTKIIISDDLYLNLNILKEYIRPLGFANIKGRESMIKIHEVFATDKPEIIYNKKLTKPLLEKAVTLCQDCNYIEAQKLILQAYKINQNDKAVKVMLEAVSKFQKDKIDD